MRRHVPRKARMTRDDEPSLDLTTPLLNPSARSPVKLVLRPRHSWKSAACCLRYAVFQSIGKRITIAGLKLHGGVRHSYYRSGVCKRSGLVGKLVPRSAAEDSADSSFYITPDEPCHH